MKPKPRSRTMRVIFPDAKVAPSFTVILTLAAVSRLVGGTPRQSTLAISSNGLVARGGRLSAPGARHSHAAARRSEWAGHQCFLLTFLAIRLLAPRGVRVWLLVPEKPG